MNMKNAWSWSLTLLVTCLFGVGLGLSLGYALFAGDASPRPVKMEAAAAPAQVDPPEIVAKAAPEPVVDVPPEPEASPEPVEALPAEPEPEAYWAARHLFITVNGQWLAQPTKAFLASTRPGGVLLREGNLGNRAQTFALVNEIKRAVGLGDGLGDLPLIAVQQEGGPYNLLGVENAPAAQTVGQRGDEELARKLGRNYGEASVGRGIAIVFAPVLDVYETGTIDPGLAVRSFGGEQTLVARMGLATADGLRQGGVLPVVKHFPGYGAATYGPDGLLVVLNKDYSGLARVMYPFNEAVRHGVPGVLVGFVAVPALDPEEPRRPAALSPILVGELLRKRWGYGGVIVADDIAFNPMTRTLGPEKTAVQALAAGCDALVMVDPDPARIANVCDAIAEAVETGELSRERLSESVARLDRWQEAIGNLNPLPEKKAPARVAEALPPVVVTPAPVPQEPVVKTPSEPSFDAPVDAPPDDTETPAIETPMAEEPATEEPEQEVVQEPVMIETAVVASAPVEETSVPKSDSGLEPRSRVEHVVGENETLEEIAQAYRVSREELVAWNGLPEEPPVAGTRLTVYLPEATEEAAPSPENKPSIELAKTGESSTAPVETIVEEPPSAAVPHATHLGVKLVHSVEADESIDSIAGRFRVAVDDIRLWNGLESDDLEAGQLLTLFLGGDAEEAEDMAVAGESNEVSAPEDPSTEKSAPETVVADETTAAPVDTESYTVKPGDTLNGIARAHLTSSEVLLELNGLGNPNLIQVGQTIQVPRVP